MAKAEPAIASWQDWRLLAPIGLAVFAAAFALFRYVTPVTAWAEVTSPMAASISAGALAALLAMTLAAAISARRLKLHNERMRIALNNMSQGLCMFDGSERLVVCNRPYMEMYKLTPDIAAPGRTLASLLEFRIANGTFSREPGNTGANWPSAMASGKTTTTEVKSHDGRSICVVNRPMAGGGWVATHEDITERRGAERERVSLYEQQRQRAAIEQAIAAFRQRVEDHLRTVSDGAMAMRTTATTLFANSGETSKSSDERGVGVQ